MEPNTPPSRLPIQAKLLDIDSFISKNQLLPVTSELIFEPGTRIFHNEGLFSERIFGKIGSSERFIRMGYIDIRIKIMQPIIYHTFMKLGSLYNKIIEGTAYAVWDEQTHNWILSDRDNPQAVTGISAFLAKIDSIQIPKNESSSRNLRVDLIEKYRALLTTDKVLVCAAGVRDIRDIDSGKIEIEEINKEYLALLSLTKSIVHVDEEELATGIYDSIILAIQKKVYSIYQYIFNIMEGKKGYLQGKFSHRHITLGTRNVITAAPIVDTSSPHSPGYFKNDTTLVPLYQAAKAATPIVINLLKTHFFSFLLPDNNTRVASLLDPTTYQLVVKEVSTDTVLEFNTVEGIEKFITNFKDSAVRHNNIYITAADGKSYLLPALIYDDPHHIRIVDNERVQSLYLLFTKDSIWSKIVKTGETIDKDQDMAVFRDVFRMLQPLSMTSVTTTLPYAITGSMPLYKVYEGNMDKPIRNLDLIVTQPVLAKLQQFLSLRKIDISDYTGYVADITPDYQLYVYVTDHIPVQSGVILDIPSSVLYNSLYWHTPNSLADMYLKDYTTTNDPKFKVHYLIAKKHSIDMQYLRPITYGELLYIATHRAVKNKYGTVTRYPVINQYGILNTEVLVQTTIPSRPVVINNNILFPRYPILGKNYQESMCPHSSAIKGYDGDYDGDALNMILLLTEDANQENREYFKDISSMVNVEGKLHRGLAPDAINNFTYYNLGYMPA